MGNAVPVELGIQLLESVKSFLLANAIDSIQAGSIKMYTKREFYEVFYLLSSQSESY